jgi:tRNA(Arg) A34 adenosine deaminase TadA
VTDTHLSKDHELLGLAVDAAHAAREHGNHPLGALFADEDGQVLLTAENTVVTESDATGHAETNLVRLAMKNYSRQTLVPTSLAGR